MSVSAMVTEELQWPSEIYSTFQDLVDAALHANLPIRLGEGHILLSETILIKLNDTNLRILGVESPLSSDSVIEGTGHSIFQVSGKRIVLSLEHITLLHTREDVDKKNIGAVVFLSGTSACNVRNCRLSSSHGFAVWAVQRSVCRLFDCYVSARQRSGCVAFGHSALVLTNCCVKDCMQHGVCLRGNCKLDLSGGEIVCCGVRAVYGYEGAQLRLTECRIEDTREAQHAAVEVMSVDLTEVAAAATAGDNKNTLKKSPLLQPTSLVAKNISFKGNNCASVTAIGRAVSIQLESCLQFDADIAQYVLFGVCDVGRVRALTPVAEAEAAAAGVKSVTPPCGYLWEYQVDNGIWCTYTQPMSDLITLRYFDWINNISNICSSSSSSSSSTSTSTSTGGAAVSGRFFFLPSPLQNYKIDFLLNKQINCVTFFSRHIRSPHASSDDPRTRLQMTEERAKIVDEWLRLQRELALELEMEELLAGGGGV
jgi:hypothetical protein